MKIYGLEELENAFVSTTEMTSLLHDIGNPPFGHFAEQTINKWITENAMSIFQVFSTSSDETKALKILLKKDLCNYMMVMLKQFVLLLNYNGSTCHILKLQR